MTLLFHQKPIFQLTLIPPPWSWSFNSKESSKFGKGANYDQAGAPLIGRDTFHSRDSHGNQAVMASIAAMDGDEQILSQWERGRSIFLFKAKLWGMSPGPRWALLLGSLSKRELWKERPAIIGNLKLISFSMSTRVKLKRGLGMEYQQPSTRWGDTWIGRDRCRDEGRPGVLSVYPS